VDDVDGVAAPHEEMRCCGGTSRQAKGRASSERQEQRVEKHESL
jgi:hypothetical protein